jgi:hypothetical protein
LQDVEQVLGLGFNEQTRAQRIKMLRFGARHPSVPVHTGFVADDFVHDVLPSARGDLRVCRGQVNSRHLGVKNGLPGGFISCAKQGKGFRSVSGSETGLLACVAVFAIEVARALKQSKLLIHKRCLSAYES